MLPEWRALVLRTNLSPVIVRLRMAWRRRDYRRARQMDMAPEQRIPVSAVDQPESLSQHPDEAELQPWTPDELAAPRTDPRPQSAPHGKEAKDAPPLPPSLGEDTIPRPRRPWDAPIDSGNDK